MNKKREINSLSAQIDLPAMEAEILDFWAQNQIFEKSVTNRDKKDITELFTKCKSKIVQNDIRNFYFLIFYFL